VPEIVRWQSPVAHMRRTATQDFELGGKTIKRATGGHVVLSGNRDEEVSPDAEPVHHRTASGRASTCLRLRIPPLRRQPPAEMQLRVVWEEILSASNASRWWASPSA